MAQTVTCPTCNRQYAVKPALAGKRAKCKCGGRIEFPAEVLTEADLLDAVTPASAVVSSAAFDQLEQADPYAIAGAPQGAVPPPLPESAGMACRGCGAALGAGAVLCMSCGMNQQTGAMMRTTIAAAARPLPAPRPVSASSSSGGGESGGSGVRNMLIGGVLVVVGLAVTIGTYSAASESGGRYYVFYGPVIWGAIMFFKGLAQAASGN